MIAQSKSGWGIVTKALHWTIAALIVTIMSIGIYAAKVLTYSNLAVRPIWGWWMNQHKALGCIVLGLILIRAIWTFSQPRPELPDGASRLHRQVAATSAVSLYMLMFAVPLAGIGTTIYAHQGFKFFGLFQYYAPIPKDMAVEQTFKLAHQICAYSLLGLLGVHLSAALMHHFVLRDGVLRRMWFQKPESDRGVTAPAVGLQAK
jgi:cytochrome b561